MDRVFTLVTTGELYGLQELWQHMSFSDENSCPWREDTCEDISAWCE